MEKFSLSELKEKRKDIADGISNPSVPENFKPAMKEKLVLIDERIAELEGVQKTKIVKPKAEPKKVVKPKEEKKPKVKVVKQRKKPQEKFKKDVDGYYHFDKENGFILIVSTAYLNTFMKLDHAGFGDFYTTTNYTLDGKSDQIYFSRRDHLKETYPDFEGRPHNVSFKNGHTLNFLEGKEFIEQTFDESKIEKTEKEPVKTGKQKVVKQKKGKSADKLTGYEKSIIEYTGCDIDEVKEVEDIMRNEIFHSTLDWQDKDLFKQGAKEAYEVYKELKKISPTKERHHKHVQIEKGDTYSEFHPASKKDDVSECKKILEAANYDVKEKTVKGKDGKKRHIQTREPRQDRTIIADRTESVFTTITKSFNSDEEKKDNKELLEIVDAVKGLMIKFMNSLDKLVASKDVDKIKKIKELLSKLVD